MRIPEACLSSQRAVVDVPRYSWFNGMGVVLATVVLTARHVALDLVGAEWVPGLKRSIELQMADRGASFDAEMVAWDEATDSAMLAIAESGGIPLIGINPAIPAVGTSLWVYRRVGKGLGVDPEWYWVHLRVSDPPECNSLPKVAGFCATVDSRSEPPFASNSGAPVFDESGSVVGLLHGSYDSDEQSPRALGIHVSPIGPIADSLGGAGPNKWLQADAGQRSVRLHCEVASGRRG